MSRVALLALTAVWAFPDLAWSQHLAVVSRDDDVLVVHDLQAESVVARTPVGEFSHEAVLDPTSGRVYVASYGGNSIHVVHPRSGETRAVFRMQGHSALHGIQVSSDGSLLWVTSEEAASVLEVDAWSGELLREWPTAGYRSHMVTSTPDDRKLYVANIDSGTVSVIHRDDGSVRVVPTGAGTEGIDITPDGNEVWVSNRAENTLSVIDTRTDRVIATLQTGGDFAVKLRIRPGGKEAWVANNRSGSISVFDVHTRDRLATIDVGIRPLGLAFSGDGTRAFVSRPGANEVVEINAINLAILRRIRTDPSPDGLIWFP